jgi:predicted nucleotidyltransferase
MKTTIINRLERIASANSIQLLFACESGSRAWGFPSPDSDYDIRFIYLRPAASYLSIQTGKDNLGVPISDELDIYGWDLRKVLQLIKKSNTTPFEWLQSPVIYKEAPGFREALWALCSQYFSQRSNIHHYLGIANGALATIGQANEIKIKKLFYILRPLLAAMWNLERNSIAPMAIAPLLELLPALLQEQVQELIAWKANAAEGALITIPAGLQAWINTAFSRITAQSTGMQRSHFELAPLDEFFIKNLLGYDYSRNKGKRLAAV